MKKSLTIILMGFILFIGVASATLTNLGTFKQGDCIDIKQTCASCTYNNLSSITFPNGTIYLFNPEVSMSKNSVVYIYSTCNFSQDLGEYSVDGHGDLNGVDTSWAYNYKITPSGTDPSTAQGIIYAILLFASFIFMILSFYGAVAINGKNEFQMGKLIKINYNKYIKQGLFFIGYLCLIFVVFFSSEISQNFLELGFFTTILNWLHIALWIILIPVFFIFVTFSIIKWLADMELMDLAKRNLKPYGS